MAAVLTFGASSPASAATTGVTVAGGHGPGSAANQLFEPQGAVVDSRGNVYVADTDNNRVQRWAPGATSGVTVAGGFGQGGSDIQLFRPTDVALDNSGNLYVADAFNYRVQRFSPGVLQGVTVAGGGGEGSSPFLFDAPVSVAVDSAHNVYVADNGNNRVQLWAPGATSGVTVAGGNGRGSAANQLNDPEGVALEANGDLYVAEAGNNRVMRWVPGATSGVIVAGGNGAGSAANQFDRPFRVVLDGVGNLYVSDTGNNGTGNNRVQLWAPGASSGVTVAGGNGAGPAANQLINPVAVALDATGNIYVGDEENNRVQRWPAVTPTVLPGSGVVAAPVSGTADLHISATLTAASPTPVTVAWNTVNVPNAPTSPVLGPEAPPSDYSAGSGVVTFAPGQTTGQVTISVSGNSTGANLEYVVVSFHDPTGANIGGRWGLGFGLIESAAHAALPTVLPGTGTVTAPTVGTAPLDVAVRLSTPSPTPVTVQWNTLYVPGAPSTSNGPQASPSDYIAVSGVVTFGPGQTTAHVTIPVTGDSSGGSEYLFVSFHDPTGAKTGGFFGLGTGVITLAP
ncbi:MAG: Calx-beta domain-containing protein [Acidimicrobiales bacterium]